MKSSTVGVIKQYLAGTSAALSVFIAGCWLGWPSPAIKKIKHGDVDIKIEDDDISWIVALMDFGNILSPIPSGYMADFLGRKMTLLFTAFLYIGTWSLAIFGTLPWHLFIARIGAGIGKGIAFTVVPMYLGEIAAALTLLITGTWTGWPSPAVPKILNGEVQLRMDTAEISWIVALMDFGNILSPIPSGYMSDWLGRKRTLLLTAFLFFASWLLVIFGTTAPYLFIARVGAGIGKGVAFTVVPMYLGEIAGVQVRGAISTIFTCLLYSGVLVEYCVGPFVTYDTLNIISATLPIVFFFSFVFLPDSPYYLLMKEKPKEARKALAWFRNSTVTDESLVKELDDMSKTVQKEMTEKASFGDLISSPGSRKALGIVIFLSVSQRFGGVSPMLAYTPITLPKTGGYFKSDMYMIIFGVTMILGNFICTPLVDSVGRKLLLIYSCTACALFTAISTVFYAAIGLGTDSVYNWVPYFCLVGYGIAYSFGIGFIPTTLLGELFPTNIKSYASAIISISFAVASFVINKVFLFIKDNYGAQYMFGFFTICSIISVIFTMIFVFETKGKTFAQIQRRLNHRRESLTLI